MALNSPGVEVQLVDESFYIPAEPSTRPLIILATAQNKTNGSGTGIATGTLSANSGKMYLVSSQRELTELFGTPLFYKDPSQNPIHGGELNEYGLQAAYSFLGVANSVYVLRANIDLSELTAQYDAPGANPAPGTYWLDTQNTRIGIFEWNSNPATVSGGQKFTNKVPMIITDPLKITDDPIEGTVPREDIGVIGDYALVSVSNLNKLFYKNRNGNWVMVGSPSWHSSWATITGSKSNPTITSGHSLKINGTTVIANGTTIASLAANINAANIRGVSAAAVDGRLEIYSDGAVDSPQLDSSTSNAIVIASGTGTLVASTAAASTLGIAVGTYYGTMLQISPHTVVPRFKAVDPAPRPTGSVWVKTTDVNLGARWRVKLWNSITTDWDSVNAPLYSNNEEAIYKLDRSGGGKNIPAGTIFVQYNFNEDNGTDDTPRVVNFKIFRRERPDPTSFVSKIIEAGTFGAGNYSFTMAETSVGVQALQAFKTISVTLTGASDDANVFADQINKAGFVNIVATIEQISNGKRRLVISHKTGGDIRLREGSNNPLTLLGYIPFDTTTNSGTANLYQDPLDPYVGQLNLVTPALDDVYTTQWYIASNWKPLAYVASEDPPTSLPEDGRLWNSSYIDEVDIMIHNGSKWVGYLDSTSPYYSTNDDTRTDPNGPIVSASRPLYQSDGTTLRNGDLWIDTSDLENYPAIYKYDGLNLTWVPVDTSDQSTEDGIVFADARYNTSGAGSQFPGRIVELLYSNFVDFDAPDPDLYPRGMLLFNTRRSGFNVKKFVRNYVDNDLDNERMNGESMDGYYPHRWVNESGNDSNGVGLFGRKAQRKVIVKRLKSVTDTSIDARDWERRTFNLIATPGYPELIANMVNLNYDRKLTAFVIGDSPFRLANDTTTLNDWSSNANLAVDNGEEGLVTYDPYLSVYYPSGFSTDNFGNDIVVPSSHMVLRTIAISDSISFPWFAPAGVRRGGVSNARSIGYIDSNEGEFVSISVNEGQRSTLYQNKVNAITFIIGTGIVVFGQRTRSRSSSAIDRVNVSRLVVYLRGQLDKLCKPYIFEPNDRITREELKSAADSEMLSLVGQRAIGDFLVVCDESNNTPTRIDRNELWLDVAIEPIKTVEFIYIPLRLKNTGEIAGL